MKLKHAHTWLEVGVSMFFEGLKEDNHQRKEVFIRRAISTIYYGVFWELRDFLRERGTKVKSHNPHHIIQKSLEAKGFKELADNVFQLHSIRKNADYDEKPKGKLGYNSWEEAFEKAFHLAILILKEVSKNG